MSTLESTTEFTAIHEDRSLGKSVRRGAMNKCPNCGEGQIFDGFLKIADTCSSCKEELHHHRADDLPAYLNIFVTGHIVVGAMFAFMKLELFGMWTIMWITIALALIMAFAVMRPLKGMVVGAQWALRMHGFGGHDD